MANLGGIAMLAELDGAVLVDKPVGVSAHDVMKAVKTHFNLVKVGHGGTLDVTASGIFALLFGDATRLSADLMAFDRTYSVELALGKSTDTGDFAGRPLGDARPSAEITRAQFDAALAEWRGDVYQAPPAFSAVMIPGRPGYEIVAADEDEARRERLVHVYRHAVAEFEPPRARLETVVAKGVSIRALVRDLGRTLGCGACVESCRLVKAGGWRVEDALPFMSLLKLDAVDFKNRVLPRTGLLRRS